MTPWQQAITSCIDLVVYPMRSLHVVMLCFKVTVWVVKKNLIAYSYYLISQSKKISFARLCQ